MRGINVIICNSMTCSRRTPPYVLCLQREKAMKDRRTKGLRWRPIRSGCAAVVLRITPHCAIQRALAPSGLSFIEIYLNCNKRTDSITYFTLHCYSSECTIFVCIEWKEIEVLVYSILVYTNNTIAESTIQRKVEKIFNIKLCFVNIITVQKIILFTKFFDFTYICCSF